MRYLNNKKGFTLIEMLIVMLIITVLIAIAIPNVSKQTSAVDEKGCVAFVSMVQGQVESYRMDERKIPSMEDLVTEGYLKDGETTCPNGKTVAISAQGVVSSEP
ncbi:competence type IV pilus major pilin ComGC [Planomicrobium sp. YIM 101495]|uniref:competence type IV pilus major pilin ComGC n=1 Tax=Planomicrobium sp. YIM 101495 TaxID=2665160 RepID=UPI0012B7E019|nr:competence type IV pilus major pilin ComGC [Planomicrobium sp. YIM 101495]MTD29950.1 prepilin-type N-terminal cleavage/methylation domain-containing protein [Planomicrobium sp. YIM 101495]